MRIKTKEKKMYRTDIKKIFASWVLKRKMNNEAIKNMNCSNNTTKWMNSQ